MNRKDWEGFSKADLVKLASPGLVERGFFDLRQGNLIRSFKLGRTLAGEIAGYWGCYRVRLEWDGESVRGECSCTAAGFCKHRVLLALGWLEQRSRFVDLGPALRGLTGDGGRTFAVLRQMAEQDPVHFWQVIHNERFATELFIHNRQMLNRVRSLMQGPVLTKADVERFGRRLDRVLHWLKGRVAAGEPVGFEALTILTEGVIGGYPKYPDDWMRSYLREVLDLCREIAGVYPETQWMGLFEKLAAYYLNPESWEVAVAIRPAIVRLILDAPEACRSVIVKCWSGFSALPMLGLAGLYELWLALPEDLRKHFGAEVRRTEEGLLQHPEGRFWLLDRWIETGDSRVYEKIVESFKLAPPEAKSGLREQLIRFCRGNGHWRQGAALCYAQFVARPNFEEYRRLKRWLAENDPVRWREYYARMQKLAQGSGMIELRLRMAGDFPDPDSIQELRELVAKDRQLAGTLAEVLLANQVPELLPCYPWVSLALLGMEAPREWRQARQVMAVYQKRCCQEECGGDWELFSARVIERYGARPGFWSTFGKLWEATKPQ